MHICDLKQDQCKRSVKIGSNEYTNMINATNNAKTPKNVKKDGFYHNYLNFKLQNKREGLEKRVMHKIFILVHSNLRYI